MTKDETKKAAYALIEDAEVFFLVTVGSDVSPKFAVLEGDGVEIAACYSVARALIKIADDAQAQVLIESVRDAGL